LTHGFCGGRPFLPFSLPPSVFWPSLNSRCLPWLFRFPAAQGVASWLPLLSFLEVPPVGRFGVFSHVDEEGVVFFFFCSCLFLTDPCTGFLPLFGSTATRPNPFFGLFPRNLLSFFYFWIWSQWKRRSLGFLSCPFFFVSLIHRSYFLMFSRDGSPISFVKFVALFDFFFSLFSRVRPSLSTGSLHEVAPPAFAFVFERRVFLFSPFFLTRSWRASRPLLTAFGRDPVFPLSFSSPSFHPFLPVSEFSGYPDFPFRPVVLHLVLCRGREVSEFLSLCPGTAVSPGLLECHDPFIHSSFLEPPNSFPFLSV